MQQSKLNIFRIRKRQPHRVARPAIANVRPCHIRVSGRILSCAALFSSGLWFECTNDCFSQETDKKQNSSRKFNERISFVALQAVDYHIPFIQLSASSDLHWSHSSRPGHMNLLNHRVFSFISSVCPSPLDLGVSLLLA